MGARMGRRPATEEAGALHAPAPPPSDLPVGVDTRRLTYILQGPDGTALPPVPSLPCPRPVSGGRQYVTSVALVHAHHTYPSPLDVTCPSWDSVAVRLPPSGAAGTAPPSGLWPTWEPDGLSATAIGEVVLALHVLDETALRPFALAQKQTHAQEPTWFAFPQTHAAVQVVRTVLGADEVPAATADGTVRLRHDQLGAARAAVVAHEHAHMTPYTPHNWLAGPVLYRTPVLVDALAALPPGAADACVAVLVLEVEVTSVGPATGTDEGDSE